VCRPAQAPDFGEREAAALDRIVPHLTRAMRTKLKLDDAARRLAAALGAFDQLATGIAIVDLELKPVVLNRRAERIVAEGDGLTLSDRCLAATSPVGTGWLRRLVSRAACDDPRVAGYYTLRLERTAPRPPWSITGRRLPDDEGRGGPLVVLMIEEIERQPGDIAPIFTAAFGFTPREAALAVELANGSDLAAAAHRLGISVGTARNYLKAIFTKTGTHRQAELVALLLRSIRLG
jgi:DNA-binding CsgD family transcriptional regulator